jgi:hypothetical protein
VDEVTRAAYESILERDWDRLRLMLHPYLHWTAADGTRLRGRTKVIERLQHAAPPVQPVAVELRDGQSFAIAGLLATGVVAVEDATAVDLAELGRRVPDRRSSVRAPCERPEISDRSASPDSVSFATYERMK